MSRLLAADQSKVALRLFHASSVALAGLVPAAIFLEARPHSATLGDTSAAGFLALAALPSLHAGLLNSLATPVRMCHLWTTDWRL